MTVQIWDFHNYVLRNIRRLYQLNDNFVYRSLNMMVNDDNDVLTIKNGFKITAKITVSAVIYVNDFSLITFHMKPIIRHRFLKRRKYFRFRFKF